MKELRIKPILRQKFSGLSSYSRTVTPIEGACLGANGLYMNGLTEEEEREFEKKLGLKEGTLSKKSPYWGTVLRLRLNNDKDTPLTLLDTPEDIIRERVIRAHPRIANSILEKNKPSAEFYIDDPEATAAVEAIKIDQELEAMEAMIKTTIEEKRGLLRLYGKRDVYKMTESMVKTELAKKVKEDPIEFLSKANDKQLKTRMLIEELIEVGMIKRKGNYYYNGEDLIGSSTDEVVAYLSDIKNQSVKLNLETKLKKYRQGK
jgi:hypothetical protein